MNNLLIRTLIVNLAEAVSLFENFKWKFFEVRDGIVRIEVPKGDKETLVVKLPFDSDDEMKMYLDRLKKENFVEQVKSTF